MKALINDDYTINPHDWFTFNEGKNKGKRLRVIATESIGWEVLDTIDTVKNIDEERYTNLKRKSLKKMNPIYFPTELETKTLKRNRKKNQK